MAWGAEQKLGKRIAGGVVIIKPGYQVPMKRVRIVVGSHPRPTFRSVRASEILLRGLSRIEAADSVLFAWSGGASALLFHPRRGITATEKIKTVSMLMDAGADIHELNAVRKHLSAVKGGQLAPKIPNVAALSMILSDVCGDNPATIGSGPAYPDDTSFEDAIEILENYSLWGKLPASVEQLLRAGSAGKIVENPQGGDPVFRNKKTVLVGTSRNAVNASVGEAQRLGYKTMVLAEQLQGDTEAAARLHAIVAAALKDRRPLCLLSGGETTVKLAARHGKGGRSQHFVLAAILAFAARKELREKSYLVLSAGTDGTDGPTDAAGAMADVGTLLRAQQLGLDANWSLRRQDSYNFFKKLGDLLITGPTNTNVMDLRIVLIRPRSF
jgi:hydroxypyruvate reductase